MSVRLGRAFATVGLWTLLSRVLGFARDILIAATLGSGPAAQAFFVAFALPNMFRRFFAEGAFNMAFVPMFSRKTEAGEDAEGFARDALSMLAAALFLLTLAAHALMPWLVLAMAAGFAGDGRLELATDYGRIVFPYILFISLAALFSGALNTIGRFAAAAAAPVLLNIVLVGVLAAAELAAPGADGGVPEEVRGIWLSWGAAAAGVAQLGLVWVAAERAGIRVRPRVPRPTPEIRRLAVIAAPAALAGGVVQINLLVGRQVASFFDGAIAWLSYADRLYQLPLGVVGVAIGVVLLPDLSRKAGAGDDEGGRAALSRAGEMALALTVPAAVALIVAAPPIVSVLYERGGFTPDDTAATAAALVIYALGLPAFVMQKVLQPLYFARGDTKSPFRHALVAMVVNAMVAVGLMPAAGYLGAAVGTTAAAWAMVWLLARGARKFGPAARFDERFRRRSWRIAVAASAMGAALWGMWVAAGPAFAPEAGAVRFAALGILVAVGSAVYFAAGHVLGAVRLDEVARALRRG